MTFYVMIYPDGRKTLEFDHEGNRKVLMVFNGFMTTFMSDLQAMFPDISWDYGEDYDSWNNRVNVDTEYESIQYRGVMK